MIAPLVVIDPAPRCWQLIGVWGDRSCPELAVVTHCHNCPVFAAAGRKFLNAPSPPGYLEEWTARLAAPEEETGGEILSLVVFRLAEEWLALSVAVLVEVTLPRPAHRIPHRGGILAGLVNIRGELHLCARLDLLLGLTPTTEVASNERAARLLVVRRGDDGWVFPVDEVDQVRRVAESDVVSPAPTLARANARLTQGVFGSKDRSIGILDELRVFQALREQVR